MSGHVIIPSDRFYSGVAYVVVPQPGLELDRRGHDEATDPGWVDTPGTPTPANPSGYALRGLCTYLARKNATPCACGQHLES